MLAIVKWFLRSISKPVAILALICEGRRTNVLHQYTLTFVFVKQGARQRLSLYWNVITDGVVASAIIIKLNGSIYRERFDRDVRKQALLEKQVGTGHARTSLRLLWDFKHHPPFDYPPCLIRKENVPLIPFRALLSSLSSRATSVMLAPAQVECTTTTTTTWVEFL